MEKDPHKMLSVYHITIMLQGEGVFYVRKVSFIGGSSRGLFLQHTDLAANSCNLGKTTSPQFHLACCENQHSCGR